MLAALFRPHASSIMGRLRAVADNALEELAGWLPEARERIRRQVVIREAQTATGTQTAVSIDHPSPPLWC